MLLPSLHFLIACARLFLALAEVLTQFLRRACFALLFRGHGAVAQAGFLRRLFHRGIEPERVRCVKSRPVEI